jgi:hypothetical protein
MSSERHDSVRRQLQLFRAVAARNASEQQFRSMAYAYPGSLGEWLGMAVQIAAPVSWPAHDALRPLEDQDAHQRRIA